MVALIPHQDNNVVALVSRTGRHLQRYDEGRRQVVGCIPYRYKPKHNSPSIEELEVLVISSQKGKGMLFPKGGWEKDETIKEAASRETIEEAGVRGIVERMLGSWIFRSKSHNTDYKGYMFPLLVQEQLEYWPEKKFRQRAWVSISEARNGCQHLWMKEALDVLIKRVPIERQSLSDDEEALDQSLSYQRTLSYF